MTANGITLLSPDGLVASPAFSHVAVVPPGATTIYVGGQNGVDAAGALVGDDPGEQTRRTMDNLVTALESAGAGLADVVSMTVLLKEGVDVRAAYAVAAERLADVQPPPLVTAAIVSALGVPGAAVEVGAVAAVIR
ncbi:RidA family protein [Nocardioides bigeumensis]|uniref:RidA family protein n=1 Tax=Nocardioides bigeumensis TaxID=433657 RepID=A0ABN2YSV7_9ACTN